MTDTSGSTNTVSLYVLLFASVGGGGILPHVCLCVSVCESFSAFMWDVMRHERGSEVKRCVSPSSHETLTPES